jgi:hypothetical protein
VARPGNISPITHGQLPVSLSVMNFGIQDSVDWKKASTSFLRQAAYAMAW